MTINEYAQNFVGYNPPIALVELLLFEATEAKDDYYSEGFELMIDDKYTLKSWSKDLGFLNQLIPFAQADSTGSFYAIWVNKSKDLDYSPIVVFGSEGGCHIVAQNILELLKLLTMDTEPMVDTDGVYYYKDEENYEPSKYLRKFKQWLSLQYNIAPVTDNNTAEQLIEKAQDVFQDDFWEWASNFIDDF